MKKILIMLLIVCMAAGSGCAAVKQAVEDGLKAAQVTRGTVGDDVYVSEYANLTFTAPEGWVYQTDEEISELMGVSLESYQDTTMETTQEILEKQSLYDMMAVKQDTSTNVIVMYENLAIQPGGVKMTEEDYIDACIKGLEDADVINYAFSDVSETRIAADTYKGFSGELVDYGATQYYYMRKMDRYMLSIIISVFGDDDIADILEYFSAAETGQ